MELFKRKDAKSWFVDLVHPKTGARIKKSLRFSGSKVEAQKRATQLLASLSNEMVDGKEATTIGAAVSDYIDSLRALGKVSVREMEYTEEKLFGRTDRANRFSLDPDQALHELRPADLERLVQARLKEGLKPQTIVHEISLLRSATKYAGGLGKAIPEVMMNGTLKNPWRAPKVSQKTRYLSVEEFEKVYRYLDPDRQVQMVYKTGSIGKAYGLGKALRKARQDCQDLLVALAYTGGRWSEVAGLTWDQVHTEEGYIRIWGNKTQEERLVPLADRLKAVLTRRRVADPFATGKSLIFPGVEGDRRARSSQAIGWAMTKCGLNTPDMVAKYGKATVHSLRHTFASWIIQNGGELNEAGLALGHRSLMSTKRYAHLRKGATIAKLGNILSNMGDTNGKAT